MLFSHSTNLIIEGAPKNIDQILSTSLHTLL